MASPTGNPWQPDPGSGGPARRPPAVPGKPSGARSAGLLWRQALVLTLGFVALLYVVEFIDTVTDHDLDLEVGVRPRTLDGLSGVVFGPVLHASWSHLVGNTVPVLVLGFLTLLTGIGRGLVATAIVWVLGEVGTWLTGEGGTVHLGASVLVFGWLTYLISRGFFARSLWQIVVGLIVGVLYGSALLGVLPGQPGISWQGHLFGALGGVIAGWMLSAEQRKRRRALGAVPPP